MEAKRRLGYTVEAKNIRTHIKNDVIEDVLSENPVIKENEISKLKTKVILETERRRSVNIELEKLEQKISHMENEKDRNSPGYYIKNYIPRESHGQILNKLTKDLEDVEKELLSLEEKINKNYQTLVPKATENVKFLEKSSVEKEKIQSLINRFFEVQHKFKTSVKTFTEKIRIPLTNKKFQSKKKPTTAKDVQPKNVTNPAKIIKKETRGRKPSLIKVGLIKGQQKLTNFINVKSEKKDESDKKLNWKTDNSNVEPDNSLLQHKPREDIYAVKKYKLFCKKYGLTFKEELVSRSNIVLLSELNPQTQILLSDKYVAIKEKGDGNCLPRSISRILTGDSENHNEIRQIGVTGVAVKDIIRGNSRNLKLQRAGISFTIQDLEDYEQEARKNGTWLGSDFIEGFVRYTGIEIVIYSQYNGISSNNKKVFSVNPTYVRPLKKDDNQELRIYLLHTNGNHYQPILPVGFVRPFGVHSHDESDSMIVALDIERDAYLKEHIQEEQQNYYEEELLREHLMEHVWECEILDQIDKEETEKEDCCKLNEKEHRYQEEQIVYEEELLRKKLYDLDCQTDKLDQIKEEKHQENQNNYEELSTELLKEHVWQSEILDQIDKEEDEMKAHCYLDEKEHIEQQRYQEEQTVYEEELLRKKLDDLDWQTKMLHHVDKEASEMEQRMDDIEESFSIIEDDIRRNFIIEDENDEINLDKINESEILDLVDSDIKIEDEEKLSFSNGEIVVDDFINFDPFFEIDILDSVDSEVYAEEYDKQIILEKESDQSKIMELGYDSIDEERQQDEREESNQEMADIDNEEWHPKITSTQLE